MAALQAGVGGYRLRADDTVRDDDAADTLTDSSGRDWFFANTDGPGARDRVTDLAGGEYALDTDPPPPPAPPA